MSCTAAIAKALRPVFMGATGVQALRLRVEDLHRAEGSAVEAARRVELAPERRHAVVIICVLGIHTYIHT